MRFLLDSWPRVLRSRAAPVPRAFEVCTIAFQLRRPRRGGRILSETAWTYLRHGDITHARRFLLDSAQAYTDVASVRGVGLSLIGLAAAETVEQRFENAVKLAAAAELCAREEGIVNVTASAADETAGLEPDRVRSDLMGGTRHCANRVVVRARVITLD